MVARCQLLCFHFATTFTDVMLNACPPWRCVPPVQCHNSHTMILQTPHLPFLLICYSAAPVNFPLTDAEKAGLEGVTAEQLIKRYRDASRARDKARRQAQAPSTFLNVGQDRRSKRWSARVMLPDGKASHIAIFGTAEEAARAADRGGWIVHGR